MYAVRKFDLSLLEEGEEYVTDITVVTASLFPIESGTDEISAKKISKLLENGKESEGWVRKGRLRLGTRSLIFEPNVITYPLLKFKFSLINVFKECEKHDEYKQTFSNNCIFLSISQVTSIPMGICNGKTRCISPYQIQRLKNSANNFIFFIFFTNQQSRSNFLIHLKNAQNGSFVNKLMDKTKFNKMSIENLDNVKLGLTDTIWAWRVKRMVRQRGMVAVGTKCIYFEPCPNFSNISCKKIYLRDIIYIFKRQCSTEPSGLEIISLDEEGNKDYRCLFLEFILPHQRDVIIHHLKSLIPQVFRAQESNEFLKVIQSYWINGRISNFHYLDFLNSIGGRSRDDLSQYPVFPWVLSDYSSSKLDLSDASTFRDLSKPIGALNEQRLKALIVRMQEFKIDNLASISSACHDIADYECEGCLKRLWECGYYLYGSHYSSLALVVHLLIRVMPECQLRLYEGNFDTWNRCFHSIGDTFSGIIKDHNCFYELIPDMFQGSDEFLLNNLNIETAQGRLDNVVLPPWANANAKTFLNLHRKALESDYVSFNLSKWIDLIFGFKQSGYRAVQSHNVFHPFTYLNNMKNVHSVGSFEGNIKTINYTSALKALIETMDPHAIKVQANEFGQIPLQIFIEPHPERQVFPQFNSNEALQYKPWFIYINSNNDKFPELQSFISSSFEHVEKVVKEKESIVDPPKSIQCRRFGEFDSVKIAIKRPNNALTHINDDYIFSHSDGSITFVNKDETSKNCFITTHSITCSSSILDRDITVLGTSGGTVIFISIPRLLQINRNGHELPTPHQNFDCGLHSINITTSLDSITSIINNNNQLFIGCLDQSIHMLSLKGLKIASNYDGLDGSPNSMAIYDNMLVASSDSNAICLWDVRCRPCHIWKFPSNSHVKGNLHEKGFTRESFTRESFTRENSNSRDSIIRDKTNGGLKVGISPNYIATMDEMGEFTYWDLRMLKSGNYFGGNPCVKSVLNYFSSPIVHLNGVVCPDNSDSILFVTCDTITRTELSLYSISTGAFETLVSIPPLNNNNNNSGILHKSHVLSYSNSLVSVDFDSGILYSFH